jgi:putative copper export protein
MTAGIPEATRRARQIATSAIATLLLAAVSLIIAAQVFAQEADVYDERGLSTGEKIAFGVSPASMMAPFEMALAREIAARQLLPPNVIEGPLGRILSGS